MISRRKRSNRYIKVFISCFLVGIVISIIFWYNLDKSEVTNIINTIKSNNSIYLINNNITDHLKILSVITLFSVFLVGLPLLIGLYIAEGFKIALRFIILINLYKFKGLIYGFIYYLVTNFIYIIMLYLLFKQIVYIFKSSYSDIFRKNHVYHNDIYQSLKQAIFIILIIFISDMITYFYGKKLLSLFFFIIK